MLARSCLKASVSTAPMEIRSTGLASRPATWKGVSATIPYQQPQSAQAIVRQTLSQKRNCPRHSRQAPRFALLDAATASPLHCFFQIAMLRFYTAGESHGQALLAFISGLPASLPVDVDFINHELHRRQLGYGRGGRQKIEKDRAEIFAGVRHGKTIGAPIALRIENRDWANWEKALPVEDSPDLAGHDKKLVAPRPGHADLAGSLKFNFHDARYILARASARETAARVASASIAKLLLRQFGTDIASHTIQVGHIKLDRKATWDEILAVNADLESPLRCVDAATQNKMKAEVDAALKAGDTVGGIFEVIAKNVPVGLGSHAQWDENLDGRLAQAVMSIQAVKAVEIGAGITAAASYGSEVMDEIAYDASSKRFTRATNRAGGLEGGITNGADAA